MAYVRKASRRESGGKVILMPPREVGTGGFEPVQDPEHRLEDVIEKVLRWGSLLSMAIILFGLALAIWYARMATGSQLLLMPLVGGNEPSTPAILIGRLLAGDPTAIISLGLLVLIATPVLRVASTVVYFLLKRDLAYLAITSFVLAVLVTGFVLGSTAG